MTEISKGQINRLGDEIRNIPKVNEELLEKLQTYRVSHNSSVIEIFKLICDNIRSVNKDAIVTYRIKRIESIIGKLFRYKSMKFSRMWDIGGCRCILNTDEEVYSLIKILEKKLIIKKKYDYIIEPQESGYKSVHIFVSLENDDKIIEIQIRNKNNHNWATLVEISDLLLDSRLKEYGEPMRLKDFHYLLSKSESELNYEDRKKIINTVIKYKYVNKLNDVFRRNYIEVRDKWTNIVSDFRHKYILIEATKFKPPKMDAFLSFREAEKKYFKEYLTKSNSNIVLIYLNNPKYEYISTAYSNYILTYHKFNDDCLKILHSLILHTEIKYKFFDFRKYYEFLNKFIYISIKNIIEEKSSIDFHGTFKNVKKTKRKVLEWKTDLNRQANNYFNSIETLQKSLIRNMPKSYFYKKIFSYELNRINKKYFLKIKNEYSD